jgi:hypothetical protein
MIAYFNSFLNIVVFLIMNKQYRHAMKEWLGIRSIVVGKMKTWEYIGDLSLIIQLCSPKNTSF